MFCHDLQIIDLFQTYITYYVLNKTTLEGIDEYATNFNKFFKTVSSKTYDALDHRYEFILIFLVTGWYS